MIFDRAYKLRKPVWQQSTGVGYVDFILNFSSSARKKDDGKQDIFHPFQTGVLGWLQRILCISQDAFSTAAESQAGPEF
jgi:hypothetical protein